MRLVLLMLLPGMAFATPPQVVSTLEELVGINATHVFLLRSVNDNLGSHHDELTDQMLVARNIDTGLDEQIWPLRRVHVFFGGDDGLSENVVTEHALDESFDMHKVLGQQGARPLTEVHNRDAAELSPDFAADGLHLMLLPDDDAFHVDYEWASKTLAANFAAGRAAMPAYFEEGGIDPVAEMSFDVSAICSTSRYDVAYRWRNGVDDPLLLLRLNCGDLDLGQPFAMYLAISGS